MNDNSKLTRLLEWLESTGRTKAWFARQVGYSYQTTWDKLEGLSPLNDRFVVLCFSNVPALPGDILEEHGYRKDGDQLIKVIPLQGAEREEGENTVPA
jgi:hypothetical protein